MLFWLAIWPKPPGVLPASTGGRRPLRRVGAASGAARPAWPARRHIMNPCAQPLRHRQEMSPLEVINHCAIVDHCKRFRPISGAHIAHHDQNLGPVTKLEKY